MSLNQFYYKRNRIQQLKGFYNVVQAGSISGAAKKIGLTQAAVTLQIQSLERDIGVKLFKRDAQKIKLTEEGKNLYLQSTYYIQGIDDLFESFIKFTSGKKQNIIDIASNHAGISYILPKYIKKFKTTHQSAKFKIRNLSKSECIKRLLNNEIDMFIYPMNQDEIPSEFEFFSIVKYQPILLTRKDHPLTKKKKVTLADIAKYELVRIDPHLITLPAFEELLKAHKIRSNIEFEMSDWEILKKFVKADIGVAMISNIVLEGEFQSDLTERILTDYFPEMNYGILIKKGKKLKGLSKEFFQLLSKTKLLHAQI
ncbi:MAG: LysR family transcriptional regulator [Proteobacteria bacterium]|nr:LysR family transcriptional regulator [Pseudomonadota bacterium]